jgi:hypothetical protein
VRIERVLAFRHQTHDLLIQCLELREQVRGFFRAQEPSAHDFALDGDEPIIKTRGCLAVQSAQEIVEIHARPSTNDW